MTIKLTREEAIQDLKAIKSFERYARGRLALDMAIEALEADTVEVVRCKDCKWYESGGLPCPLDLCESLGDDGFCSYGERSEE